MNELRAYLESAGAILVDETRDAGVTPDFFGADAHHGVKHGRGLEAESFQGDDGRIDGALGGCLRGAESAEGGVKGGHDRAEGYECGLGRPLG